MLREQGLLSALRFMWELFDMGINLFLALRCAARSTRRLLRHGAFFPDAAVSLSLADGWPEGGVPGGRVVEEVIDGRLASCLEKQRTTGRQRAEWRTKQLR